jgi:hypothetical protein
MKLLLFTLLLVCYYYCSLLRGCVHLRAYNSPLCSALRSHEVAHGASACALDLYSRAQLLWQVNIVEVIIRHTTITARDIPFCTHNCTDVQLNLALVSPVKLLYVGV